ncbi:unnamed protein product, partial [Symbiodinium pilosum]
ARQTADEIAVFIYDRFTWMPQRHASLCDFLDSVLEFVQAQVTEEVSAAAERPCAVLAPGAAGAVSPRRLRAFAR